MQFMKTYESQDREALHVHAMVRINGVCTDRRLRAAVRLCVARWDFGRKFDISYADVHEGEVVGSAAPRAGGYVAKYVTKGCDALESVPMLCSDGVVRGRRLRVWSASRRWGLTMKDCKLRRSAFMRAGGGGGTPQAGTPPAPQAPLTSKGIVPQSDGAEPGLTPIGSSIAG